MKLSDLIKQATDILASQGDIFVDLQTKENRYTAKGIDIERRNSTSDEKIAVIFGSKLDDYK